MSKSISRRSFLKGLAGTGISLGLASAIPAISYADSKDLSWDDEAEVIVVGSGTGLFAARFAVSLGHSAIVLEKNSIIGGTTLTSGGQLWVPCNRWAKEELGGDWTEEEAFSYLKGGDLYNGTTDEKRWDYIHNMHKIAEYLEDELNYPLMLMRGFGEYDKLPEAKGEGHSIGFAYRDTGERMRPTALIPEYLVPEIEQAGGKVLADHPAKNLIQDDEGKVIGVRVVMKDGSEKFFHATEAVILAAGGFDHNEDMCKKFLRGPLFGTRVSSGNTGDGIRLGMGVGADIGNMQNTLGGNVYLDEYVPDTFFDHNMGYDFGTQRARPYTMIVNKHGRRFMDESVPYSNFPDAVYNFDTSDHSFTNIPAHLIFSDQYVELFGWPNNSETMPEWVHKFETLEELAEFYGINAENLVEEVERFNGFAETGVDKDFTRGTNPWSSGQVQDIEGLANKCLGKIEGPYYCCLIGPASLGTKGGLVTNLDAQVINVFGEIIEGLYAIGTNASAVLGWTYGGGGGGVGPGVYGSFKAINHIYELHLFDSETA